MDPMAAAGFESDKDPYHRIRSVDELNELVAAAPAVLVFFSGRDCGVCDTIKPRVATLLYNYFPRIQPVSVDCAFFPEACGQSGILSVPSVIVFFEGREWLRLERNFSLAEFHATLDRPYRLLFEDGLAG